MGSHRCGVGHHIGPPTFSCATGNQLLAREHAARRIDNLGWVSSESLKHGYAIRCRCRDGGKSNGARGGSSGAATKIEEVDKSRSRGTTGRLCVMLGELSGNGGKVGHKCVEVRAGSPAGGTANDSNPAKRKAELSVRALALAACFGGIGGLLKALVSALPPDFGDRWRSLLDAVPGSEVPIPRELGQPTVIFDRHGEVVATIAAGGYSAERNGAMPGSAGQRSPVSPGEIPSWMWQAVVASEDRRFFKHCGVDPRGLSRAVFSMTASGGGSTITQQLVKNACLSNERKWTRKLLEILLAIVLETQMSKWDILYRYLKKIYWGHGIYGIDGASALYFGKHPSLLTLEECTMLAGMIPAPELLSPYHDSSRGKKPQGRALRRMVEAGFLDTATAVKAASHPLRLAREESEGTLGAWKAPYFVSEVLCQLTQTYGWTRIACGGLQVHTTLDLSMQSIAEEVIQDAGAKHDDERILLAENGLRRTVEEYKAFQAARQQEMAKEGTRVLGRKIRRLLPVRTHFSHVCPVLGNSKSSAMENLGRAVKPKLHTPGFRSASFAPKKAVAPAVKRQYIAEQEFRSTMLKYQKEIKDAKQSRVEAAMVGIDPMSGAVHVLVGGRDYYEKNFNRATKAFRSPGSVFKPVVYLTALAEGFKRNHILMDEPFTIGDFTPENDDQKFRGPVTLEQSLLYSLNVPTARLCAEVGVDKVHDMGKALGIKTYLPHELSLALGGCEVTPMQLATVYATIAAGGVYHEPYIVSRVETSEGQILGEHKPSKAEQSTVINETAVAELRTILQAVIDRGTGRGAYFGRPCAGKTGNSDDHRDIWFAGFTPEISCVVWLGYDDKAPVGGCHLATGASHGAPIWKTFMNLIHEGLPVRRFHDIGTDKNGSRASGRFEKRSQRSARVGPHKLTLRFRKRIIRKVPWRQIWDWEKASVALEEQEKMADWASRFVTRAVRPQDWPAGFRPVTKMPRNK